MLRGVLFTSALCSATAAAASDQRLGLARCAAIQDDGERLVCYDKLAQGIEPQSTIGAAIPEPGKARPTSPTPHSDADDKKLFGLTKPLPAAQSPDAASLQAKVVDVSSDSLGNVYVRLDADQTWTLTDANALIRRGDAIVIKHAALGSFIMTTPSRRTYRVRRIK